MCRDILSYTDKSADEQTDRQKETDLVWFGWSNQPNTVCILSEYGTELKQLNKVKGTFKL